MTEVTEKPLSLQETARIRRKQNARVDLLNDTRTRLLKELAEALEAAHVAGKDLSTVRMTLSFEDAEPEEDDEGEDEAEDETDEGDEDEATAEVEKSATAPKSVKAKKRKKAKKGKAK